MSETAETLEHALARDLHALGNRFVDEEFSSDLYRALAGRAWSKDGAEGRVALSWTRAEQVVNEQRLRIGYEALLAQTGGEGEVTDLVAGELAKLGWRADQRARSDPDHLSRAESPPPPDHGERMAPVPDSFEWGTPRPRRRRGRAAFAKVGARPGSEPGRLTGATRREAVSSVAPICLNIDAPCVLASRHVSRAIRRGNSPDRPLAAHQPS
jgi:hypothetical protein